MARRRRRQPVIPFAPRLDGSGAFVTDNPITRATRPGAVGDKEIVRRQRILKAHGYDIVVDGRWGPLSRRFWRNFQETRRKPVGPQPVKPKLPPMPKGLIAADKIESRSRADVAKQRIKLAEVAREANQRAKARAANLHALEARAQAFAAGVLSAPKRPKKVDVQLTPAMDRNPVARRDVLPDQLKRQSERELRLASQEKQRILTKNRLDARKAWAKPAAEWTSHDVWLLVSNEATRKLDVQNPQHVRRIQHWLNAKGYKVSLSGRYDKQTDTAFKAFAAKAQKQEDTRAATQFVNATMRAGILVPGRGTLPVYGGKIPTRGELIRLLSDGTFSSQMLFTQLWQRATQPDARYLLWADDVLSKLERDIFGPFGPSKFLGPRSIADRAAAVSMAATNLGSGEKDDAANDTFVPQVLALAKSHNAADFKVRAAAISRSDENRYRAVQAQRAHDDGPSFWGRAFDALSYPSDKTFEFLDTASIVAQDALRGAGSGGRGGVDPQRAHEAALAEQKFLQEHHPWVYMGITLVADPINLAPGLGTIRAGGRFGTEALHRAGLALSRKGAVVAEEHLYRLDSLAMKGIGSALRAPREGGLAFAAARAEQARHLDESETALGKVWRTGKRLGRLKDETHQIALNKARVVLRRGFRKPRSEPLSLRDRDLYTNVDHYGFDPDFSANLDRTSETMRFYLQKHAPTLVKAMVDDRLSLAGLDSREVESMVGGMLVGRLGAEAQHTAIEQVARTARRDTYDALLKRYQGAELDELRGLARDAGIEPDSVVDPADLARKIAFAQAQKDYDRVLHDAAFYAIGGVDAALARQVDHLASRSLDRIITVLHADLQELLEDAAEQRIAVAVAEGVPEEEARAAHGLFDENGAHQGSDSAVERWLNLQARAAFEDTVVVSNRRFGRVYTREEHEDLVDIEVRQRMRQLSYHRARRGADGRPVADDQADRFIQDQIETIKDSWLEVTANLDEGSPLVQRWLQTSGTAELPPLGSWIDTRPTIEVPRIYARHLTSAHVPQSGVVDVGAAAERRLASHEAGRTPETHGNGGAGPRGARERNTIPFALNRDNLADVVVGRVGEGGEALMRRAGVLPHTAAKPLVRGFAHTTPEGHITRVEFVTWDGDRKRWVTFDKAPRSWEEAADEAIRRSFSTSTVEPGRSVLGAITDVDAQSFSRIDDELQRLAAAALDTPFLSNFDFEGRPFARGFRAQDEPLVGGTAEIADFQNAVFDRAQHLQLAYDAVLPKILMREGAVWQAMAEAEHGWLKVLYSGMSAWLDVWTTLTLPFRPAFALRNVIDNTVKMLVAGVRDPRMFFLGGEKPGSVFNIDLRAIRFVLTAGHRFDQNPALRYFDAIVQEIWDLGGNVLGRIFQAHGIPVPEEAIEGMRMSTLVDTPMVRRYQLVPKGDDLRGTGSVLWGYYKDRVWELMADRPETFAKRALYRDTYYKAVRDGADPTEAFQLAMDKIDRVLYDYSKLSSLEHNLKFIFPFAFYWRKSTTFWASSVGNKPWLPTAWDKFEDGRDRAHADQPEWQRRYFNAGWIGDVFGAIPGLEWVAPHISDFSIQFDPANFFSFTPLYRAFKSENPNLPPDKAGLRFIAPMADALNDVGLSFNPIVRKPLEMAGIFNYRAWQTVFPETALADAFAREHLAEMFPNGFNIEAALTDPLFEAIQGTSFSQMNEQRVNELVQKEIAAQVARGEKPSRKRAMRKVQQFTLAQTIIAFFAGTYVRNNDPGEHQLYVIADELRKGEIDFLKLPPKLQNAYSLFKRRGWSPRAFDAYQQALPAIQAYYSVGDYRQAQAYKRRHPEILPYVAAGPSSRPFVSKKAIRHVGLQVDTVASIQLFRWAKGGHVNPDLVETTRNALVTPELEAFWAKNDTKVQRRTQMLRGEFWRYFQGVQDAYFAIPDDDFPARDAFQRDNPILSAGWGSNNTVYDDLRSVEGQFLSDLREAYFEHADAGRWGDAHTLLEQHPFIFDGTSAEGRVWNGILLPDGPTKARDFRKAYAGLQRYFALANANKKQAYRWLKSGDPLAKLALAYFAKYPSGSRSQHAKDFVKVKGLLDWFFNTLADNGSFRGFYSKWEWVFKSDDPAAKRLRWYFTKYGKKGGRSQKARDYLKAKKFLDHYFALVKAGKKDEARDWLNGGSKGANLVLDFFKKYSKTNQYARKYAKRVRAMNPELDQRLKFWSIYFGLPPDQQPGFVHRAAERYGIFVYGIYGDEQRSEAEKRYLRWAKGTRMSKKAAMYLRLKPMLDFYFKLEHDQQAVFKRLNPEVADYLAEFSDTNFTKDKHLNKLIAHYVRLPDGSPERSEWLKLHPEVQDYFDEHRPTDSAIRNLLEVYFGIEDPDQRSEFSLQHPEIQAYFDARRNEKSAQQTQLQAFDEADPRLAELRDDAYRLITLPSTAKRMQLKFRSAANKSPKTIESRRDRRPDTIDAL